MSLNATLCLYHTNRTKECKRSGGTAYSASYGRVSFVIFSANKNIFIKTFKKVRKTEIIYVFLQIKR